MIDSAAIRILLVDDEECVLRSLRRLLWQEDYEVLTTTDPDEALQILAEQDVAIVVSDQRMPGVSGVDLLTQVAEASPETLRIILTGSPELETALDAVNRGAVYRYLLKPWSDADLRGVLREAAETYQLRRKHQELQVLTLTQVDQLRSLNTNLEEKLEALRRAESQLAVSREKEIRLGRQIQESLLLGQGIDEIDEVAFGIVSEGAQCIAGDFYEIFARTDRGFDLVLGDVMGKGVGAALLGAATKIQLLSSYNDLLTASGQIPSPADVVTHASCRLGEKLAKLDSFVTLCYARFDLVAGSVSVVTCGHPPIVVRHESGEHCLLQGDNMPLGVMTGEAFVETHAQITPGDVMCFYSDGLTDARRDHEMFGERRLIDAVQMHGGAGAGALAGLLREQVIAHGGERLADDLTCVVVEYLGPASGHIDLELESDPKKLGRLRGAAVELCADADIVERTHVELAVTEAATNIMRHAYAGRRDHLLRLRGWRRCQVLTLELQHRGVPFDGTRPRPARSPESEGGFGLEILDGAVDHVEYTTDRQIHTVRLTKHLNSKGDRKCN